jgi:hypothetical protein
MQKALIHGRVWPKLSQAACKSRARAYVAVAYFGEGAESLLKLSKGSILVVDASDGAVRSGQTCPASLETMVDNGVKVFSRSGLHAKVFVFGTTVYVGSANVSNNSAKKLIEAVVAIKDRRIVSDARQFVRKNCTKPLGPRELARLSKLYSKPEWQPGESNGGGEDKDQSVRIVRLIDYEPPEEMWGTIEKGERAAKRKMKNKSDYILYDFYWGPKHRFVEGELILPIHRQSDGRVFVCPPSSIVEITPWRRKKSGKTIVFLEMPRRRRVQLEKLARYLGRGAKRRLQTARILRDDELADGLFEYFSYSV